MAGQLWKPEVEDGPQRPLPDAHVHKAKQRWSFSLRSTHMYCPRKQHGAGLGSKGCWRQWWMNPWPSIRVFSSESALCIMWPKYWSFSFSFSPSNEYSGLVSFRMDWLDLLAVQGILNSFLWHCSSKASVLQRSAFIIVQLSHPYMTTGKTIALTRWIFFSKVMSLLFNTLSRFVIAVFPRSKHLLISGLQSPPTLILEPKKMKCDTVSTFSPSICHEVIGLDAMIYHDSMCEMEYHSTIKRMK